MLEDLLRGNEASRLILITDTSLSFGRHVVLNWMEAMFERCEQLVLLCYERPPDFFKSWLQPNFREKLICLNGDDDDLGESQSGLDKALEAVKRTKDTPTCLVIDSLSLPILFRPAPSTCSYLHRIAMCENVVQVAALVHRDVTDSQECNLLEHISSSVIDIIPSSLSHSQALCDIRHCRSTGKVFKMKEFFEMDDSFRVKKIGPLKSGITSQQTPTSLEQEPDPTTDLELSFKLQLTESEKEARSQVLLPYLKDGSIETSTSKIIYEADDADDFDEEDPDDDLNI